MEPSPNMELDPGLYRAMKRGEEFLARNAFGKAKTLPAPPSKPKSGLRTARMRLLGAAAALGGVLAHPSFPEADSVHALEKEIEAPSQESENAPLKTRMTFSNEEGVAARAFERRGYQLQSMGKSEEDLRLPESGETQDEEFSAHIVHRVHREALSLLNRQDIRTRDMYGDSFHALEVAIDASINRVLRASLQDAEREEIKTGNLFQADLLAVQSFAKEISAFVRAYPEQAPRAVPMIEALIRHAEDQWVFTRYNTLQTSPAYTEHRASFDLFLRDLRGTQFRIIPYTEDRIDYLEDPTDRFAERTFAAIKADLPWFITNRADIAANVTVRTRTIYALRSLLFLPSHNHAQHHAMRSLVRYLERS